MASLSPLNFRGLLAQAGITPNGEGLKPQRTGSRRAVECWKCAECFEVYDWEDEAEECCATEAPAAGSSTDCPICGQASASHRDAADCCLWKDMVQAKRYECAEMVERGATWLQALGFNHLGMQS